MIQNIICNNRGHTVLAINKKFRQTKAKFAIFPQILPCKNQTFRKK